MIIGNKVYFSAVKIKSSASQNKTVEIRGF